ncbi:uncharacterized protein LOC124327238 isoform X1 [Daphnia pulicaria]|uniref:uncharacterized protein LOC124327238 isoform X1 n=1 Tax=Daphnia pulicaria TaxID=35523 RepID=UPI001EEC16D3|nr:uncharacterized protein LOC124327238 isoform X1 [Daphnia pulicaria]
MESTKFLTLFSLASISFLVTTPEVLCDKSFDSPSETTESFSGSGDFDTSIVESLVEIGENETASANQTRDDLVKNLTSVGDEIEKSVTAGNQEQTLALLTDFKHVWFQLVNKSSGWYGVEPQDLRIYAAKILFLAKDRLCESPDQTYFNDQCILIGDTEHCPENMELNDGPKNEGFCDCLNIEGQALFYSDETGSCHVQNTRGPCREGQWFVFRKALQCEPVPDGCPADGQHVYWSPDDSASKKCWEIGCQGPCSLDQILHLEQITDDLNIYCRTLSVFAVGPASLAYSPSCRVGTLRNRLGKCIRGFWG